MKCIQTVYLHYIALACQIYKVKAIQNLAMLVIVSCFVKSKEGNELTNIILAIYCKLFLYAQSIRE